MGACNLTTTTQFMLLSQFIIFILGWLPEWTEIIVIFMPIFPPAGQVHRCRSTVLGCWSNFADGFLSPPVAMAAFYLGAGGAACHAEPDLAGMMPFMVIQVIALLLLYIFPAIGLWP